MRRLIVWYICVILFPKRQHVCVNLCVASQQTATLLFTTTSTLKLTKFEVVETQQ